MSETLVDLEYKPRAWQRTVHNSLKRFSVLVAHRRSGKTVLAIMTLVHAALKTTKNSARFAYVAPFRGQAKDVAWKYLKSYVLKIPGTSVNESELWVELPNGSQVKLYGADNPDALRGIYLDGVVMDEVADMRPDVWGEIIRPALSDRLGWALFIGTPKGMNLFSEVYYNAQSNEEWYAGLFTCYDTDALPPTEIEALKASMSEDQFAQELLCSFEAGNSSTLLSMSVIEEACKRELREDQYSFASKILGVDVARQGDDSTCIFRRQGLAAFEPQVFKGMESMAVAAQVAKQCDDWQPDAVFIDGSGGYGAGVIDRLRQLGYICTEVQFGGRATDDRFVNKRTEMWLEMAAWVKAGGALPNRSTLKLDLSAPTYHHKNAAGKMALESKDAIKARGLPSPDEGDALALTFAYPVAPKSMEYAGNGGSSHVSDPDPFAD
jgi:hypothetical protein